MHDKMRTYVAVAFDDGSLSAAPFLQWSNTSLDWFIVKYHDAK